jgi:hypothetical protein
MNHRFAFAATAATLVFGLSGMVPAPVIAAATNAIPRYDHVVIVMEENHSYGENIGSPSAPYITALAQQGANFTDSHGVTHPSEPNYIALFSGSTQGVTGDPCPAPGAPFSTPNLGQELIAAGLTFGGYSESMPSVGYTGCKAAADGDSAAYAYKHNPWVMFNNVPAEDNMPLTSFPTDFNQLPTVSIVVPNQQNDQHSNSVQRSDDWLKNNMGAYAEWAKTHNSLLIVIWDEDDFTVENHIPTIFVGQHVVPGDTAQTINHYNVLRTLEDMYGLSHAGAAATSDPITGIWDQTPPEAYLQFDPDTQDLQVFGRDGDSGVATPGPITPAAVTSVMWGHNAPVADGQGDAQLRTYLVKDKANNSLQVAVKVKKDGHELKASVVSMQYNGSPVIMQQEDELAFEWAGALNGNLKELNERLTLGSDRNTVAAKFAANQNATEITADGSESKSTYPGMVLVRLTTDQGHLGIEVPAQQ